MEFDGQFGGLSLINYPSKSQFPSSRKFGTLERVSLKHFKFYFRVSFRLKMKIDDLFKKGFLFAQSMIKV